MGNRGGQLGRPELSHLYLLSSGRMQNRVRQFQPFGGHLALNGAIFLIGDRRHNFQTMRGVPSIFLVLGLRWNSHDSPLKRDSQGRKSATGRWGNLFKSDQPHVRSGGLFVVLPAEHGWHEVSCILAVPYRDLILIKIGRRPSQVQAPTLSCVRRGGPIRTPTSRVLLALIPQAIFPPVRV